MMITIIMKIASYTDEMIIVIIITIASDTGADVDDGAAYTHLLYTMRQICHQPTNGSTDKAILGEGLKAPQKPFKTLQST